MSFNIEQLKLPPPPPPPTKHQHDISRIQPESKIASLSTTEVQEGTLVTITKSPRISDNIESIDMDMDLSDDDFEGRLNASHDNLKLIVDGSKEEGGQQFSLEPPPPLPDLPDDVDANNLLDDLSTDLHEFSNLSDELNNCGTASENLNADGSWNQSALMPPPGLSMNFRDLLGAPPPAPPHLLNAPPPMMNVPGMAPPPLNAPPPPPVPPSNADMMSPPPMPMMPPPFHSNWLSKDTADMMQGHNEGMAPHWMNDKEQQHNQWTNEEEYWENEDVTGEFSVGKINNWDILTKIV